MKIFCPDCQAEYEDQGLSTDSSICRNCGIELLLTDVSTGANDLPTVDRAKAPSRSIDRANAPTRSLELGKLQPNKDQAECICAFPAELGKYRLKELVGTGGFAHVFRAINEETQETVAIKLPRLDRQTNLQFERFRDEAKLIATLDHPGIVRVRESQLDDSSQKYIVMDYIQGSTLQALLQSGHPLSLSEATRITATIAEAVHFANSRQIFHRDLKPGNILLDEQYRPYVADFGLAVHEDQQFERAGEVAGTLPYMAPEQVRGEVHRLDGRTDIWSVGVMFYQMLTGRLPFRTAKSIELTEEIIERDPRPPRQINDAIPLEINDACLKCLAKQPSGRYSAAIDFARDITKHRGHTDSITPRTSKKAWAVLVATLLLLAVGIESLRAFANAFYVDDYAELGIPYTFMESTPRLLIGRDRSIDGHFFQNNNEFNHRPDVHRLQVSSTGLSMLAMGSTSSPSFDLGVEIRRTHWFGEVGLFWGYSKESPFVHAVGIRCDTEPASKKHVYRIRHYTWDIRDGVIVAEHSLGGGALDAPAPNVAPQFGVSIRNRKMNSYKWKDENHYKWRLSNPKFNTEVVKTPKILPKDFAVSQNGQFGVYARGAEVSFRNGTITLIEPPNHAR